ncbi:hypothetical protein Tco_0996030 [Tanacetum coccineum]
MFWTLVDITYVENDDGMIHYVLQKQCFSDDDSFDLPLIYNVNGHSLHLGRRKFCIVTAFKFGLLSFCEYRNGDIPFRNRLFPEKIGYDVKIIDVLALLEDEEKFSKIWILECSCVSDRWWTKVPEIIPRALSWRRKAEFNKFEYFGDLFHKTTSEDESDIKDDTSPKEVVYCCDDNGDASLCFMPTKHVSQTTNQDFSSDLYVLNGLCKLERRKHYKYTYSSKQDDQIIQLADQRQHDDISNMAEVAEHKIQSEIQRFIVQGRLG